MEEEQLREQFTKLAKSYKDTPRNRQQILIPYYQELARMPAAERAKLQPLKKELEYIRTEHKDGVTIELCDNDRSIFLAAMELVISDTRHINTLDYIYNRNFDFFCELLAIHCPKWIRNLSDKNVRNGMIGFPYHNYISLHKKGFIKTLDPVTIARELGSEIYYCYDHDTKTHNHSLFLCHEEFLKEHVWYLFQEESVVAWNDQVALERCEGKGEDPTMQTLIVNRVADGQIDRARLITAVAEAISKGLTGGYWFANLLVRLRPTPSELLAIQDQLIACLYTKDKKAFKTILQLVKTIATADGFHRSNLIDTLSGLLFYLSASSISTASTILDTIAKKYPDTRKDICQALCQLLIHKSDTVQKRVANLITRHGNPDDKELADSVITYLPAMRQEAKKIFQAWLPQSLLPPPSPELAETAYEPLPLRRCRKDNELEMPKDKDDALFLIASALFSKDAMQVQQACGAAVMWARQFTEDDLVRMQNLFAQATETVLTPYVPVADKALATFFLEFGRAVEQFCETKSSSIKARLTRLKDKMNDQHRFRDITFATMDSLLQAAERTLPQKLLIHHLHDHVRMMNFAEPLPPLSLPTHRPGFIRAETLVERLASYQQAGVTPLKWDLQIACLRCSPDNAETAAQQARQLLHGELLHLMLFLLGEEAKPQPPFTYQAAWYQAGLIQSPEKDYPAFAHFLLNNHPRAFFSGHRQWNGISEGREHRQTLLLSPTRKKLGILWPRRLAQEFLDIRSGSDSFDMLNTATIYRSWLFSLFPALPAPILAQTLDATSYWQDPSAGDKHFLHEGISFLQQTQPPIEGSMLLFVAFCMISSAAETRITATELWLDGCRRHTTDTALLGQYLVRLLQAGVFPVSRLKNLILNNFLHRDSFTDKELKTLLRPIIDELSANPRNGSKQLQQLYQEI